MIAYILLKWFYSRQFYYIKHEYLHEQEVEIFEVIIYDHLPVQDCVVKLWRYDILLPS